MNTMDFSYLTGNERFRKLYFLVDGIYPLLACFVAGLPIPITKPQKLFTAWQESSHKDIERAFGGLKARFRTLVIPSKRLSVTLLKCQMYACIILHNMLVEERIMRNEDRSFNMFYRDINNVEMGMNTVGMDDSIQNLDCTKQKDLARQLEQIALVKEHDQWYHNLDLDNEQECFQLLTKRNRYANLRWADLCNADENNHLLTALFSTFN